MKTRIITAFLIIACVIPPLVFGGVLLYALLSFIIVAGGLELMALREPKDETWPLLIKPLAIACVDVYKRQVGGLKHGKSDQRKGSCYLAKHLRNWLYGQLYYACIRKVFPTDECEFWHHAARSQGEEKRS